jgi:hypothetical protein
MTIFRITLDNCFGDVVLAAADRDGLRVFQSAVRSGHEGGQATFEVDGVQHRIVRESKAADIELGSQSVALRRRAADRILDKVAPLIDTPGPGHQYIDGLTGPAPTLLISVDEYL